METYTRKGKHILAFYEFTSIFAQIKCSGKCFTSKVQTSIFNPADLTIGTVNTIQV